MLQQILHQSSKGVLIVAHGERGGNLNNARLLELADEVRQRLGNVEVEAGVLRGSPSIADAWANMSSDERVIYPFFMADGFFCNRILPKKVSEAIGEGGAAFEMLPPFGVSDWLSDGIAAALLREMDGLGLTHQRPPLLIVAHGASVDRQSSNRAHELADRLKETGYFGPVSVGFLDEAPYIRDMVADLAPNTLVLPHFNGLGSHSVDDMAKYKARAPKDVHFITPVGGQDWVGEIMTADIIKALSHVSALEAAE